MQDPRERGAALDNLTKSQWNDSHWDEFNQLDKEFTAICIKAERRCGFPTDSPGLHRSMWPSA